MSHNLELSLAWSCGKHEHHVPMPVMLTTVSGEFTATLSPSCLHDLNRCPPNHLQVSGFPDQSLVILQFIQLDSLHAGQRVIDRTHLRAGIDQIPLADRVQHFTQLDRNTALFIASTPGSTFGIAVPELGDASTVKLSIQGILLAGNLMHTGDLLPCLETVIAQIAAATTDSNRRSSALEARIAQISAESLARLNAYYACNKELANAYLSLSWKITEPLRLLNAWLKQSKSRQDKQRSQSADIAQETHWEDDLKRIQASAKKSLLFVLHEWGGGTEKHVYELARLYESELNIFCLQATSSTPGCNAQLWWINSGKALGMQFMLPGDYDKLIATLKQIAVRRVHFHHLVGHHECVRNIAGDLGVNFDFTVHDYFIVCPQIHLVDCTGKYCGQPDYIACNQCISAKPPSGGSAKDIRSWRQQHAWLVENAERIIVPSVDVHKRLQLNFPEIKTVVAPHPDLTESERLSQPVIRAKQDSEPLRVLVLGSMTTAKGIDVLESCAIESARLELNIDYHLLGSPDRELRTAPESRLTVYGQYQDQQLGLFFKTINPHLVWFPAQLPETYSYTLSACLKERIPIVATNMGALPERLANRQWTWIRDWQTEPAEWNKLFLQIATELLIPQIEPPVVSNPPVGNNNFYKQEYLYWLNSASSI